MSWNDQDDKDKKRIDRNYVSCDEDYEKEYIIKKIQEKNSDITKADAEIAIDQCCRSVPAPRSRKDFYTCLEETLPVSLN